MSENKSILKTVYLDPLWVRKDPSTMRPGEFQMEMRSDAALFMCIKDNETGDTEIKMIERPKIKFYMAKEGHEQPYPKMAIDRNLVDEYSVEYSKRDKEISKIIGKAEEYDAAKRANYGGMNRNSLREWVQKNIYNNPNIYQADMNIEDYYRTIFIEKYGNNLPKLNRAFADIETLVYYERDANQDNPIAQINMISYYDERKNTMYGFVLNIEAEGVDEVRNDVKGYIDDTVEKMYDETYDEMWSFFEKTKKNFSRPVSRPQIQTDIRFYDDEELLIIDFFKTLNNNKPDVCAWWNMNYDIKYIIGRCKILGIDYSDLFCNEEIPQQYRRVRYMEDPDRHKTNTDKKKAFQLMWDVLINPGYTEYIDQMSLYANFRKRYPEKSYKLDFVSAKTIGTKKVDLHSMGCSVIDAPIKKFKEFLKYSLKDTFLLKLIDDETDDLPNLFFKSENTRVEQFVKITIVIKNLLFQHVRKSNMVLGNNVVYNEWGEIQGAIVANPKNIDVLPDTKGLTNSLTFSHVVDFDASSEYPNIMIVFNIGKDASFGRVLRVVDRYNNDEILMSGDEFAHALQASETSIFDLCSNIFKLPTLQDIMDVIENKII